jgi:hypothetical protein
MFMFDMFAFVFAVFDGAGAQAAAHATSAAGSSIRFMAGFNSFGARGKTWESAEFLRQKRRQVKKAATGDR